mgnify:CR=1 FL=1
MKIDLAKLALYGGLLVVGLLAPFAFPNYTFQLAVLWVMILFALTWDVMGGQMGYNSLGNIFFFGAGMYTSAIVQIGLYYDVALYTTSRGAIKISFTAEQYYTGLGLGIIAAGRLQCLGGAQHLKSKFGGGYTIEISVGELHAAALPAAFGALFPGAQLSEHHVGKYRYALPQPGQTVLASALTSAPGGLLHAPVSSDLPVSTLCMGQRVPEDIAPATRGRILDYIAPRGNTQLAS